MSLGHSSPGAGSSSSPTRGGNKSPAFLDKTSPTTVISVTPSPISVDNTLQTISHPGAGAISTFLGVTRNTFGAKRVVQLEYECYDRMAVKEIEKIVATIYASYSEILGVAVVHRVGRVPVGEASVLIAVASAHRRAALESVAWAIDELKAKVPIWKLEVYEDGSTWKANPEFQETVQNLKDRSHQDLSETTPSKSP